MKRMSERDAWTRLGLTPGEAHSPEELHAAYRRQAKDAHPDAGGDRQAWDELAEAYAMLAATGQHIASDQPENAGVVSRAVWGWRGWTRMSRVGVVLVVGALVVGSVWAVLVGVAESASSDRIRGSALVLTAYVAGWWVWWIARESRRPPIRPLTWVLVPRPPFFEVRVVDSPGVVK